MKQVFGISVILFVAGILFFFSVPECRSQTNVVNEYDPVFKKGSVTLGFGFGRKSYLGSMGITSNIFFSKSMNISLAGGVSGYNGFLFSAGPEFCGQIKRNKFLIVGCPWTVSSGSTYDVIDDESPFRREYETWCNQYFRPYIGLGISTKGAIFKCLLGYSLARYEPRYTLYHYWTDSQIQKVKEAMSSGFSFCITVQMHRSKAENK